MENLTKHFFIPLCKKIFEEDTPCMSHEAMEVVSKITNWFASPDETFLREFNSQKSVHIL